MDIRITYSKLELEMAVEFCYENNPYWQQNKLTKEDIRKDFLESMHRLATNREATWVGAAAGCVLIPDCTEENMDNDEYSCHIMIYVPPDMGYEPEDWDEDAGEEIVSIPATEYWKTGDSNE
jgi:hypothetical protein